MECVCVCVCVGVWVCVGVCGCVCVCVCVGKASQECMYSPAVDVVDILSWKAALLFSVVLSM